MAIEAESHTGAGALNLTSAVAIFSKAADAATAGRYTFDVRLGSAAKPMNSAACTVTLKLVLFDGTNRWMAGEASVSRSALSADPAEHGIMLPPGAFDARIANGQTVTLYARTNNAGDTSVDTFVVPLRVANVGASGESFAVNLDGEPLAVASLQPDYKPTVSASGNTAIDQAGLLAALEADLIDDETHEAVMAAIVAKLSAGFPELDTLTLTAIAAQMRTELQNELAAIDDLSAACTETRLAQLDAENIPAAVAALPTAAMNASAVWSAAERTLTGFGTLVASIWSHATRRLTGSFSVTPPSALTNDADIHRTIFKGGTRRLCARVLKDGAAVTQAMLSAAEYSVYLLADGLPDYREAVAGYEAVALDVSEIIFDELQTDQDQGDYNFAHAPPVAAGGPFAVAGRRYLVEYTLIPVSGQRVMVRFVVSVI